MVKMRLGMMASCGGASLLTMVKVETQDDCDKVGAHGDASSSGVRCVMVLLLTSLEFLNIDSRPKLAKALREALGLNIFNIDVIGNGRDGIRHLVIDINYFPGYAKLPSFEPFFTDFLFDVVPHKTT